ncbi:MAG: hypothetical protein QNI87_01250 [Erythrobacter sp.]|uniref:hypothetical protein n=1 Tax=Erythrobacter sp. TaxID=1042 RepID=UPI0026159CE2|nr:hypothetical protein [Erythrobacter sp.]MDJ0977142.1 hypothetical protein [Erythrobacter sp.]
MSKLTKFLLAFALLAVWGPYLLYVWWVPGSVPEWAYAPGMRRALMLSRDFEPTFFTLLFGIMFTALIPIGVYRAATGKLAD